MPSLLHQARGRWKKAKSQQRNPPARWKWWRCVLHDVRQVCCLDRAHRSRSVSDLTVLLITTIITIEERYSSSGTHECTDPNFLLERSARLTYLLPAFRYLQRAHFVYWVRVLVWHCANLSFFLTWSLVPSHCIAYTSSRFFLCALGARNKDTPGCRSICGDGLR